MEPAQIPRIVYSIRTSITKIFRRDDGIWFVHFHGSWESLGVGTEKPDWEEGDRILITIEKDKEW